MILSDFATQTQAKWILAGEHAVLRGHAALVFPIQGLTLELDYQSSSQELRADFGGETGEEMHLLFWSVLQQGMQLLGKSINSLSGRFTLDSAIPLGVGVGASAALCVAMASWFQAQSLISQENRYQFAKELEHLFHGKSSGLDIAGVSAQAGIHFQEGRVRAIEQNWHPEIYLSHCGQIGMTSHCIQQVNTLWAEDANEAGLIDQQMANSVALAEQALALDQAQGEPKLAKAIQLAASCFKRWGLLSESLDKHRQKLLDAGALAVKPTGSGGGGNVISLWNSRPNIEGIKLVPVG